MEEWAKKELLPPLLIEIGLETAKSTETIAAH